MNILRDMALQSAVQQASESKTSAMNAEMVVSELRWKVDKLTLANMALFELLQAKFGLTEEELMAKMTEIDMRDNHLNGQAPNTGPVACETCGKTYSKRHNHCLYCGHVNRLSSPF